MGSYTDPVGRTVTVEGGVADDLRLWQSRFAVTTPLDGRVPDSVRTRTLTVSHAGNHDNWLADDVGASKVGEYSISAGVLEIWAPRSRDRQGLARWRGPFNEVTIFLPFQKWENHAFALEYFDGLNLTDSRTGVRANSTKARMTITVHEVSALAGRVGLLEIRPPALGLSSVPSWAGLRVAAGEIWKVEDASQPDVAPHLVMATPSAVATLSPGPSSDLDTCLSFLNGITSLTYRKVAA